MAQLAQLLFSLGVIVVAVTFAAYVGHAVMLANGRRTMPRLVTAPQPAFAGVVTGSFAEQAASRPGRAVSDPTSPLSRTAYLLGVGAITLLGLSLVFRALSVGRGPWGNMFEFTVAFGFTILAGYQVLERRYPIRSLGFIPFGVALALLLYASSLPNEVKPLVPALQNAPLLTIHVGMAVVSYGIFATAFAAGVGYLIQGQHDRFGWLPSHKVLDEVAYRAVIVAFPIFATMIILGSWWASIAWSRYWGWDPKETAALVTWLIYAVYLHARNQKAWAGRPAALLLVVGFGMVLVTYSGSLWFSGLHAYSGL
jgi:cytochrome c-type biogenesis protein CcsB